MNKRQTRLFAIVATGISAAVFLLLTFDSHRKFDALTNAESITPAVVHGNDVWHKNNCINCHTIFGEGAYYAPDLTKAWLDPSWGSKEVREQQMIEFLMNPQDRLHNGVGRRMPNLGITEEEARATVAFLKWMSAINTLGFPNNFKAIDQSDAPAPAQQ